MKAVLVGLLNDSRVYYDMEAGAGEKDAIIEKPNGSSIRMNLIHLSSTARNFRKLRSTPFQRFLWDSPQNSTSGAWYETFIQKTRPVKESLLESMPSHSVIGKNKKKVDKTKRAAKSFISSNIEQHMLTKSCCDGMIKLNVNNYSFKTEEERAFAWEAMNILRSIEENKDVN
jgi:hypothetical protein